MNLAFTYDSQCRRVRKQVWLWQSNAWAVASDTWFAYDGWNVIREERRPDSLGRRFDADYVWGLDLSGSMQGAGGIGGLLFAQIGPQVSGVTGGHGGFFAYDGNGNVISVLDATNGTSLADFEYSPFGETLKATGPLAFEIPFRFSTKYNDQETGLVYDDHRYYSPTLGRFPNRDPLQEEGGVNLYAFTENNAVDRVDPFGERWHYQRNKEDRAVVWFDDKNDTLRALAFLLRLDEPTMGSLSWFKDADGKGVIKPEICHKYTVPNKVLVVIGWHNRMNDILGLSRQANAVKAAYEKESFKVVLIDEMDAYVSSGDIGTIASKDTWGFALFGHGKGDSYMGFGSPQWYTGGMVLRHEFGNTALGDIADVLTTTSFGRGGYGAVIAFFCHADAGGWNRLISRLGSYDGGQGLQAITMHPDWSSWVENAVPPQKP